MPRLGLGSIDLSAIGVGGAVTGIDDFFFESFSAGQMHPMLTTSRTNLIEHSEDIGSNGFSPVGTTVVADQTTSPDGTQTADLLKEDNSSGSHFMFKDFNLSSGKTYTISVFAKSNGANRHLKYGDGGVGWSSGFNAFFDLTNGTTSGSGTVAIDDVGNGWFRCSVTGTTSATTSRLIIYSTLSGTTGYQGDNSSGIFLYGLQIEEDGFVSAYIPTSGSTVTVPTTLNDTSDVWDFDGTDIMIAEDPEDEGFWERGSNLVLNHDFGDLSSELVTNGTFDLGSELIDNVDFSSDTWWQKSSANVNISNGKGNYTAGTTEYFYKSNTLEIGKRYKVVFEITDYTTGYLSAFGGNWSSPADEAGTFEIYFKCVDTSFGLVGNSFVGSIDNVSVKQVDWDLESSWGISGGKANYDAVVQGHYLKQTLSSISAGETVKIQFDISDVAAGKTAFLKLEIDGSPETVFTYTHFSAGTYTYYHKITSGLDRLNFVPATSSTGGAFSIDNVTVKQVDPNDRWNLGTGWTISDGKAHADTSSTAALSQTISTGAGNTYEVTFTVSNFTTGVLQPQFDGILASPTQINSNGTHTVKITALGSSHGLLLYAIGTSEFSIDNVTIKEYAIKPKDI